MSACIYMLSVYSSLEISCSTTGLLEEAWVLDFIPSHLICAASGHLDISALCIRAMPESGQVVCEIVGC